jgi:hypothetical protein
MTDPKPPAGPAVSSHAAACKSQPSQPAGSATTPCTADCTKKVFATHEVSQNISETISGAPEKYAAWNGTYSWTSKFAVEASRSPCHVKVVVKIKVTGTITAAQKKAWKSAIEKRWTGNVKLVCPDSACKTACPNGYPVKIELQYVTSGEHYEVTANTPEATEGGRAGIGGTTSMTGWGVNDTTDITHEFGHMLGCPEEYFTTDGVDHTDGGKKQGFRDSGAGIMNNPAGVPKIGNYKVIQQQAASAMGLSCTTSKP